MPDPNVGLAKFWSKKCECAMLFIQPYPHQVVKIYQKKYTVPIWTRQSNVELKFNQDFEEFYKSDPNCPGDYTRFDTVECYCAPES